MRAKHARTSDYIYSRKRSFLSLVVVTSLLSTSVIGSSAAVDNLGAPIQVPGLCDPSVISQPVFVSPTPTPSSSPSLSAGEEVNALVSPNISILLFISGVADKNNILLLLFSKLFISLLSIVKL